MPFKHQPGPSETLPLSTGSLSPASPVPKSARLLGQSFGPAALGIHCRNQSGSGHSPLSSPKGYFDETYLAAKRAIAVAIVEEGKRVVQAKADKLADEIGISTTQVLAQLKPCRDNVYRSLHHYAEKEID